MVVTIMNVIFSKLIPWLVGAKMQVVMHDFKWFCCLPNIQGAINGTHIAKFKTLTPYPKDYFYHKTRGYSIVMQAIVDCQKIIFDICVAFLGSVNDSRMLCKSILYKHVQFQSMFNVSKRVKGIPPYLLGDKSYPLINWIMAPFKENGYHMILKLLYDRKHRRGQSIVETTFGIKKQTFKELRKKNLHVYFLLDYLHVYYIIYLGVKMKQRLIYYFRL
jgi:hypothetical protein